MAGTVPTLSRIAQTTEAIMSLMPLVQSSDSPIDRLDLLEATGAIAPGTILAQARSLPFDVVPRHDYTAPGGLIVLQHQDQSDTIFSPQRVDSTDAADTILPPAGGPNVRLCLFLPVYRHPPLSCHRKGPIVSLGPSVSGLSLYEDMSMTFK